MKSLLGKHLKEWMDRENQRRADYREAMGNLVIGVHVQELTPHSMAKESGINEMTLKRILENETYKPGDEILESLADYLHEDVHLLFDLKRGIAPEDRQDALDLSYKSHQLSDTNRDNIDRLLMDIAGIEANDTKGLALLRGQLHE